MGFYGEIVNTGEAPFVFDKIYSSRYHMERSMAADGVYSGRFVLISYDSSYNHNSFKRAYIKDEDAGPNTTSINLYKDTECTRLVRYKNFNEEEPESAVEVNSAILSEIYYVKNNYTYTYYICRGNDNGIALFDYYQDMNSLFYQAYRDGNDNTSTNELYWDEELTDKIMMKSITNENGVNIGDVLFVDDSAAAVSEKERAQGIFTFYECVGADEFEGAAIFNVLNTVTGHYQDETLENYIFNQKLDYLHYGTGNGVHNYDKTIWQKVYIGEKEKYIKVASLNAEFPKIKLTVDSPEAMISHPPYFDTDVNGQVEDLHVQPQWGLRVGAANKAMSVKGSYLNVSTGNYVNYLEYLTNNFTEYALGVLQAREARASAMANEKNNLRDSVNDLFINDPVFSVVEERAAAQNYFVDLFNGTLSGITYEAPAIFAEKEESYMVHSAETYSFTDLTEGITYIADLEEYYCEDVKTIDGIIVQDNTINSEEETSNNDNENIEENDDESVEENANENSEESLVTVEYNPIYNDLVQILGETVITDIENVSAFTTLFNEYFNNLGAINKTFNMRLCELYWNSYLTINETLFNTFNFDLSDDEVTIKAIVEAFEGFRTDPETGEEVYKLSPEKDADDNYLLSDFIQARIEEVKSLIEEDNELNSDEEITWHATANNGNSYAFDGYEWVADDVTFPGDIYYNKAGFNSAKTSRDNETIDTISITPTGLSQVYDEENEIWVNREYSVRDSEFANQTAEAPDTQELSIHLPSIGNTMSDVWDIIYGEGVEADEYERKTNIAWDNTTDNRTRLIHETENGGYTHTKKDLATVAGAINTTQDLIGRIIIEDVDDIESIEEVNELNQKTLDSNYIRDHLKRDNIYYFSGDEKYYIVNNKYDFDIDSYEETPSFIYEQSDYENLVQGYNQVELIDANNLSSDYYYWDSTTNTYVYNKIYSKNKNYFTLNIQEAEFATEDYRVNDLDDLTLHKDQTYIEGLHFSLSPSDFVKNKYLFIPGEFYVKAGNRFQPAYKFNPMETYYLPYVSNPLSVDTAGTEETLYGTVKFVQVYSGNNMGINEIGSIIVGDINHLAEEPFDSNPYFDKEEYVFACFIPAENMSSIPLGHWIRYHVGLEAGDSSIKYCHIITVPAASVSYTVKPEVTGGLNASDGTPLEPQSGDNFIYGVQLKKFGEDFIREGYEQGKYYYATASGYNGILNYALDMSPEYTPNRTYYDVSAINTTPKVYEKGKYYIYIQDVNENIDGYILSTSNYDLNQTYYEHNIYYVTQDYLSHTVGEIWDYTIPWSEYVVDTDEVKTAGRDYYYDVDNKHPVQFTDDFSSNGSNYYIKQNNNFVAVAADANYDLTKNYYVKLISTNNNIYSGSDGKRYQTATYNNVEYDVTEYQGENNINVSNLTPVEENYTTVINEITNNLTLSLNLDWENETVSVVYASTTNTLYGATIVTDVCGNWVIPTPTSGQTSAILYTGITAETEVEITNILLANIDSTVTMNNSYKSFVFPTDNTDPATASIRGTYITTQTQQVLEGKYLKKKFEVYTPNRFFYLNNYADIIRNCKLVSDLHLKLVYGLKELVGFGRQFNTINGLIVKINNLLGEENSYDRNLDTIHGSLRRLNDEINRLSLYKTSMINDIVTSIHASFDEAKAITDQLVDLRNQAQGAFGGVLTEDEAVYYYPSTNDLNTIIGFNFKDNTNRKLEDILYVYNDEMTFGNNVGQYEKFVTALGVDYYKMHVDPNESSTGFKQGYVNQNIGYEKVDLTAATYESNKYYIISNSLLFTKAIGNFDVNQTYYQLSNDLVDIGNSIAVNEGAKFGIRTKSDLNPDFQLFSNSSFQTNQNIIKEIDNKVNIESYYNDIGRVPTGMHLADGTNPSLIEEVNSETGLTSTREVFKTGSILDEISNLKDTFEDINQTLYGNGESNLKYDLVGNWLLNEDPMGGGAFNYEFRFIGPAGTVETYTKIEATEAGLKYYYKDGETLIPKTVYDSKSWRSEGSNNAVYVLAILAGSENPHDLGLYELYGGLYVPTTDITVQKYYTVVELKLYEDGSKDYVPGKYYVRVGSDYVLATEENWNTEQTYYQQSLKNYFRLDNSRSYRNISILPDISKDPTSTTFIVDPGHDLLEWLKKNAVYCGNSSDWTADPNGLQPTEESKSQVSIFRPESKETEALKSLNTRGLLARLTALDTNLSLLGTEYETLVTELKTVKQTSQALLGLIDADTAAIGIPTDHKVNVLDVDAKYGFKLISVVKSDYTVDKYTKTYNYQIIFSFTPTSALPAFSGAFLKVDNVEFYNANQFMTVHQDINGKYGIDAFMQTDGTIYLRSNGAWDALPSYDAYQFVLNGQIVDKLYDENGNIAIKQKKMASINFYKDSSYIQGQSNCANKTVSFAFEDGAEIIVPGAPSAPAGCHFLYWVGVNDTSSRTPVKRADKPTATGSFTGTNTNASAFSGVYVTYNAGTVMRLNYNTSSGEVRPDANLAKIMKADGSLACTVFYPVYALNSGRELYNLNGSFYNLASGTKVSSFASGTAGWTVVCKNTGAKDSKDKKNQPQWLVRSSYISTSKKKYYISKYHKKLAKNAAKSTKMSAITSYAESGALAYFRIPYRTFGGPSSMSKTKVLKVYG